MNDILKSLISFPTITADLKANFDCLSWCRQTLKSQQIDSCLEEKFGRPILVWGAPLDKCETLICSHVDVVPAPKNLFDAKEDTTTISGRGSADNKSSVAIMLSLPKELIALAKQKNITFALVTDEETGGNSTRLMINSLKKQLKSAIFMEPTNLTLENQAKGIIQIKITASGKSAHGSRPWTGKNAITNLSLKLSEFLKYHPIPTSETYATTYNFSQISGGTAINQIPSSCELWIDIRFNPQDNPKSIISEIKDQFRPCKVEVIKLESPIFTSPQNKLIETLSSCLAKVNIKPRLTFDHASSDARHCTALKIPAVVFGPTGSNLHQDNEYVITSSLSKTYAVIASFIESC
jgi:succinyl-diaminopimelate desuccinylase